MSCSTSNSRDGQHWSDNSQVKNPSQSQSSKAAPALAVFQDKLWIAFVANSNTNQLLISNSRDGQHWSDNSQVKNPKPEPIEQSRPSTLGACLISSIDTNNQVLKLLNRRILDSP